MKNGNDILEIMELIQLSELVDEGYCTEKWALDRLNLLKSKYSKEDVESLSLSSASRIFGEVTGFLHKQKCTNKDCNYTFRSQDVSETCDICYHPTLRILND